MVVDSFFSYLLMFFILGVTIAVGTREDGASMLGRHSVPMERYSRNKKTVHLYKVCGCKRGSCTQLIRDSNGNELVIPKAFPTAKVSSIAVEE